MSSRSSTPKQTYGTVAVVGQGYVGLPLSVAAARSGWTVIGIDSSPQLVENLGNGKSHVEDVSSMDLEFVLEAGTFSVSTAYEKASDADVCIFCVPTPLDKKRKPDLGFLESAVKGISLHLKSGTLLINESTSFPGTLREVIFSLVDEHRPEGAKDILFAAAPERIDPMNKEWTLVNTPRLVGGIDKLSTQRAIAFYKSICKSVIEVSTPEVAECAKLVENTYRQVNIALVNQLVPFCRELGLDTREVVEAAGTKPYGFMKFFPGAGVGGHCIPIDPLYLLWKSQEIGVDLPFVERADETNRGMPEYVAKRLIKLADLRRGDKALILGVAYKSGIADVRETPARDVFRFLDSYGVEVYWSDPLVSVFNVGQMWNSSIPIDAAIVVTAQPGLQVETFVESGIPILDCTGVFKGVVGVSQL